MPCRRGLVLLSVDAFRPHGFDCSPANILEATSERNSGVGGELLGQPRGDHLFNWFWDVQNSFRAASVPRSRYTHFSTP